MLVGQQLGPFAIDRELGHGAMGAVYRARYTKTGQHVAIKVMAPGTGTSEPALARFEREADILKQLKHPNIVRLLATGRFHGQPFYAMEYIEGESLDKVIARRGRITWEEVVTIGKQLCAALQHAHDKGIVHRDLKPSNLMVLKDGTVKLTDFGIAKDLDVTQLTSANCTVGTAAYMSPEQCRGERNLTHKSDLYSMGIMLYELVVGRKPFESETPMDMFLQHVHGKFERPSRLVLDIPVWFDTLICQLLEKKPEQRPRDAEMVAEALEQVEEKVATLKSAGVDAAQMRRMDRSRGQTPADETDRRAARSLLTGLGKMKVRRRKKDRGPVERKWLQAVGILLALALIGGFAWWITRPPSADKIYAHARKLMESSNPDDWAKGRDGPVEDYLKRYGLRNDDQTRQVQAWANREDVRRLEDQMNRRRRLVPTPEGDEEQNARRALDQEESGNLEDARKSWQAVQRHKEDGDSGQRTWGLLADKRLRDLDEVDRREQELQDKVIESRRHGLERMPQSEPQSQAARALHYQTFGDAPSAFEVWKGLREKESKEGEQRLWYLLAAKKCRELQKEVRGLSPDERRKNRIELATMKLAEAENANAIGARIILNDIIALYGNEKDYPELVDAVAKASQELKQLG